jgi:hypothetical protein
LRYWLGVLANQWGDRLSALRDHLEGPQGDPRHGH